MVEDGPDSTNPNTKTATHAPYQGTGSKHYFCLPTIIIRAVKRSTACKKSEEKAVSKGLAKTDKEEE